jgi:hypothetical protein
VLGGRLTGLVLPGYSLVSVPSRGSHWSHTKAAHLDLTHEGADVETLTWATTDQVRGVSDSCVQWEWRARVLAVLDEVDAAIEWLAPLVDERCRTIAARVQGSSAWSRTEQERAYGELFEREPLGPVLRVYHRTRDVRQALRRAFRGPGAALSWTVHISRQIPPTPIVE